MDASQCRDNGGNSNWLAESARGWNLSRRSMLSAGALLGMAAIMHPTEEAFAWSSWTNATSPILKEIGMGDCVHEDLVQISYARVLQKYKNGTEHLSFLNPWAGKLAADKKSATIAGDTVERSTGAAFTDDTDLQARLFRENLAYLRIGSFWNDAAADTLVDFGYSCLKADAVPKFSGSNYYEGAWDVGQHLVETNAQNGIGLDALVQFTMNDRNNFIHGMLSSTADHSSHLKQAEVKKFALQWLGVAYEYARTGRVTATKDVTQEQAEKIFKGFIDTYEQLDESEHGMCVSLKVSSEEASRKLPRRRMRLRALGMMCHTMEDFWCPAHTCRTYHEGDGVPKNSILAFSNYKRQNGAKKPMFGYHIPFDRYAVSDSKNSGVNWREALTRGVGDYVGTEKLANVVAEEMRNPLDQANTKFNTLGMNETIDCITKLLDYMYRDIPWDDVVRSWVDKEVMPTYLTADGQSYVCDAGRRSLHTPTYVIDPIRAMKRAYRKAGLADKHKAALNAAIDYSSWQRGAHLFYSGEYNKTQSKIIPEDIPGADIWSDKTGEQRLVDLVNKLKDSYSSLDANKQSTLLAQIGCNGCHDMVIALDQVRGMLQEFNIDLRGGLRSENDEVMNQVAKVRAFFAAGLSGQNSKVEAQTSSTNWLHAADVAYADDGDESYVTSNMAIEDFIKLDDGSYLIAVRDMDSLETSVMEVPAGTPGVEKLAEGFANLAITYTLEEDFEGDIDYCYIVTDIDYSDLEEDTYLVTGTVKSVSSDSKKLVLDLNGIQDFELAIRDGISAVPQVGEYICARYAFGKTAPELVDYDVLDDPGTLVKVTYPVEMVAGTSVLLLVGEGGSGEGGSPDYMQIDYGTADVFSVPQEGKYATVYYHDEVYGDTTDVDEYALTSAAAVSGAAGGASTNLSAQSADDDNLDDSPTPGYIEAGDDYSRLNYGNDVFHVANVIISTSDDPDNPDDPTPSSDPNSGSASTKPTSKASASSTAKTGDPLGGLGGVLSAAAVAGTALAAYSARRVANERRKAEEE